MRAWHFLRLLENEFGVLHQGIWLVDFQDLFERFFWVESFFVGHKLVFFDQDQIDETYYEKVKRLNLLQNQSQQLERLLFFDLVDQALEKHEGIGQRQVEFFRYRLLSGHHSFVARILLNYLFLEPKLLELVRDVMKVDGRSLSTSVDDSLDSDLSVYFFVICCCQNLLLLFGKLFCLILIGVVGRD